MACGCNKRKAIAVSDDITLEPIQITEDNDKSDSQARATVSIPRPRNTIELATVASNKGATTKSEAEAIEIDLIQCYLCAKKHVARAQEFFQELHTGYPAYIKNLLMSVRVAEDKVREAFLLWQKTMAQLNMGEGELLGKEANKLTMSEEHKSLANRIRTERLRLSDDPLYVPDFGQLLVDIHILQHRVMELK